MTQIVKYFCLAFALVASTAQAADVKSCLGSYSERIDKADVAKCEKIAQKKNLTARQQAQIYLQLAITAYFARPADSMDAAQKTAQVFRYLQASSEADNTFGDTFLAMADVYRLEGKYGRTISSLDEGLKTSPDDARLLAKRAEYSASAETREETRKVCVKATASPIAGQNIYFSCGRATRKAGLLDIAEIYLYKAAMEFETDHSDRFLDIRFGAPSKDYADLLVETGRGKDAVKFYEMVAAKQPSHPMAMRNLAEIQEKSGDLAGAAKSQGNAASSVQAEYRFRFQLLQVITLARAGKPVESFLLAKNLFDGATLQQVLSLQVKLKNGSQKDLTITGKFDDQTRKALSACINDKGCFANEAGQPI